MIYFATTTGHSYTIEHHLKAWGRDLVGRLRPVSYRQLLSEAKHPRGVYVFADIERMSAKEKSRTADLYRRLRGTGSIVLNDPAKVRLRAELLTTLHDVGVNRFRVHRVGDDLSNVRFPVFLRCANDHRGSRTKLLTGPAELGEALAEQSRTRCFFRDEHGKFRLFRWGPRRRRELLITEFCDTADSMGVFRKYSAFAVAGRIVPRHLFFGDKWMLKAPEIIAPEWIEEERRYVSRNPHAVELREIFSLARIEYGRIDYGVCNGEIQVWEINTNPMITHTKDARVPQRLPAQEDFSRRLSGVFRDLEQLLVTRQMGQQRRAA